MLTDLEGAKTEFREAEIVHRVTLVWQGWTYLRLDQRKANSSKFQERKSQFPSGSTSPTALDTSVLQLSSGTSISTPGSKSSLSELGLVSY